MAKFMVMARDSGEYPDMSPEEIQGVIQRYIDWSEGLRQGGRLLSSEKLGDGEGRVIRREAGALVVSDGPYAESKEVLGGFWIIEAADYDEAVRLVSGSPHFDFGTLEVRRVEEMEDDS